MRLAMPAAAVCMALIGMSLGDTPRVPLVKDLTIVEAWKGPAPQGDYETSTHVDEVDDQSVSLTLTARTQGLDIDTRMSRATMRDAHTLRQVWTSMDPEVVAGATSAIVSSAVLSELTTKGATRMTIIPRVGTGNGASDQMSALSKVVFSDSVAAGTAYTGTLRRVESGAVQFAMLINGQPSTVAAIHARGKIIAESDTIDTELFILADPALPLVLASGQVGGSGGRVIRITYPDTSVASRLEKQLASGQPAEVYDIYFDYNSATITPQSDVTLHTIGDIMRRHPDWHLDIVGHTDSVGGTGAANAALSARRGAAVKDALSAHYGVVATRLTTRGAGSGQPLATNATLEGRAKNRRVELRKI